MIGMETAAITAVVAGVVGLLAWSQRRYPPQTEPLVDAIDALLPQTQCAQCGYPGCRPYAVAVASGASLDLCPPGGAETQRQLADLLGRDAGTPLPNPRPVIAKINESQCIGCFLCVDACPVDAIVGAPRYLHTVIEDRCTGCELCLPPCPVDCIDLLPLTDAAPQKMMASLENSDCIRCGRCDPVCPEELPVQQLWWVSRQSDLAEAEDAGLDDCIECGLCNPACPSGLDLVGTFRSARLELRQKRKLSAAASLARQHVAEHDARIARQAARAQQKRQDRLSALKLAEGGRGESARGTDSSG